MPDKKKKHRVIKWVGGILGGLIVLLLIAALYLSAKWKPILTEKIKEGVYNGSAHLYTIDFKDIHLNLFSGNLTMDSISLMADTAVYDSLKRARLAPTHLIELKLPQLQLSRISILTAYLKRRVEMNAIILKNPSINVLYSKVPKRRDTIKPEKTLYQQISSALHSIHVKNIRIIDSDLDYYNRARSAKPINSIKHLDINVKDVLIDSLSQFDTTRLMYARDINFELAGYSSLTKDKMYTMKVDTVSGSATAGSVDVKGFKLLPMYKDLAFSRMYSTQKDRYDLNFSKISLSGVDFITLARDGILEADKLKIGPAKVAVFMNRELPPPNFNKGRNFPHIALSRLPFPAILDSLQLAGVDVEYTEFSEQTRKRGTIVLKDLGGTILNLTNDSAKLAEKSHAIANLYTRIMGTGKLDIRIDFDLNSPKGAFSYTGNIGSMDLKVLNPLATNLGLVSIESGFVKKIDFSVQANLNGSSGILHMYYNDLKINLLKKEDGKIKEKGFLSFLANNILVINDNPKKDEAVRPGKVSFSRPMTSSFFNLLWKGLFTGIRETVGIGVVPMKKPPAPKKSKK